MKLYETDFSFSKVEDFRYSSEYSMTIILCKYEKNRCVFYCVFRKYMFCVQFYGK